MAATGEKKRLRLGDVKRKTTAIMAATRDIAGHSAMVSFSCRYFVTLI